MRFEPGTVVKIAANGRRAAAAIVIEGTRDHVVKVLADGGIDHAMGHDIQVPRTPIPFVPMRLRLPYGQWLERDGTRVLFSRDYCPLWRVSAEGQLTADEPWRLVKKVRQETFWQDPDAPWHARDTTWRMANLLSEFGAKEDPLLARAIRYLVDGAKDIREAVHRMTPAGVLNSAPRILWGYGPQPAVRAALC